MCNTIIQQYNNIQQQQLFIYWDTFAIRGKKEHHGVPKALVVEAGLLGHPGGIPAAILVLIRAADLV